MQVEDRLPAARADVDDHPVVVEARRRAPCRRRTRACRFASSGGNSPTSRNVSTCRSGRTSRCVSAFGSMSRIATKPSAARTWSPSRTSLQKRQSSGSEDTLLRDGARRGRGRARRPARRRATASSRRRSRGRAGRRARCPRAPSFAAQRARHGLVRQRAQPRAALLLHGRRHGVARGGRRPGPRRVREDVHLRDPRVARPRRASGRRRASSSPGKPTITSVVRLKSRERLEPPEERRRRGSGGPSRAARASSPDWSGTCRCRATAGVSRSARPARRPRG